MRKRFEEANPYAGRVAVMEDEPQPDPDADPPRPPQLPPDTDPPESEG